MEFIKFLFVAFELIHCGQERRCLNPLLIEPYSITNLRAAYKVAPVDMNGLGITNPSKFLDANLPEILFHVVVQKLLLIGSGWVPCTRLKEISPTMPAAYPPLCLLSVRCSASGAAEDTIGLHCCAADR